MTNKLISLTTMMFTLLVFNRVEASAQPAYYYGYSYNNSPGNSYISFVSTDNLSREAARYDIPKYGAESSRFINTSHNREWVLLELTSPSISPNNFTLRLVRRLTGEIHDFSQSLDGLRSYTADYVSWSPNNRYVAMNVGATTEKGSRLLVYDLETNLSTNLVTSDRGIHRFAWSHDSSRIVTDGISCTVESTVETCEAYLEIYNVSTGSLALAVPLPVPIYLHLRDYTWSPDDTMIVFASGQYPDVSAAQPKEFYILDIAQASVQRLTDYTLSAASNPDAYLRLYASSIWIDNDTVLAGIWFSTTYEVLDTQSFVYQTTNQETVVLSNAVMAEWQQNPVTGEIAFKRIEGYVLDEDGFTDTPQNPSVQIATFDGTNFNATFTGVTGCHLSWSPDGSTLAYIKHEGSSCSGRAQSIIFVDNATKSTSEYLIPEYALGQFVRPLGWFPAHLD